MRHPRIWLNLRILLALLLLFSPFLPIVVVFYFIGLPVWIIGGVMLLTVILQYRTATKTALSDVEAVQIEPKNGYWEAQIDEMVTELSTTLSVPKPTVYYGTLRGPNAFATGRKGNGHIVISPALVQLLTETELKAVLAHELSHLHSRDILPMVLSQGIGYVAAIIVFECLSFFSGGTHNGYEIRNYIANKVRNGFMIPALPISRQREYIADKDSADALRNEKPLQSALLRIQQEYENPTNNYSTPPGLVSHLCIEGISNPLTKFLSTHPPLKHRIEKLNSYQY